MIVEIMSAVLWAGIVVYGINRVRCPVDARNSCMRGGGGVSGGMPVLLFSGTVWTVQMKRLMVVRMDGRCLEEKAVSKQEKRRK